MRILLLLILLIVGSVLNAEEMFKPEQRVGEDTLHLRAADVYTVGYFWKVFDIALFESEPESKDVFASPLYLEIRYNRTLSGERLAQTGKDILRDLKGEAFMERWAEPIAELDKAYADVKEGDRYGIYYNPEGGMVLYRNGEEVLALKQVVFARAYLDIWLGGHEKTEDITETLLKGGK